MTSLKKFDYVVDPASALVLSGRVWDEWLGMLCPVLVGKLRAQAERESSARLYVSLSNIMRALEVNEMLLTVFKGDSALAKRAASAAAAARVLLAVASSELAKRYSANTLEPELRDERADDYAKQQVELEDSQQQPPETVVAIVDDGASDGIV